MIKNDCKIVQDLLPNYIENLTLKETNEYVESHIEQCKECSKALEIMRKGIENEQKKSFKQIDYLKKYKNKMHFLKSILLIIAILVIVFLGIKLYKWQLLLKLFNHNANYDLGNNYRIIQRDGNTGSVTEKLYKDGISFIKFKDNTSAIWSDGSQKYIIISKDKKYFVVDNNQPPTSLDNTVTLLSYLLVTEENSNTSLDILSYVFTHNISIRNEEYGEHKCYVVKLDESKFWVDKDSLFVIREDFNNESTETTVETNVLTNEDIKMPDLSEYERIETN